MLCPVDIVKRLQRAAQVWDPIIKEKLKQNVIKPNERIPVTCGADTTPVPAHPQYCWRRNIILGLCGPVSPYHKCSLDPPVQISNGEAGFHQIVELVTTNVWASYVYTHILQPQVITCSHTRVSQHTYMHCIYVGGLAPSGTRAYVCNLQ